MKPQKHLHTLLLVLAITLYACSTDDENNSETDPPISCENSDNLVYEEKDGLVVAEFESITNSNDWNIENTVNGFLGTSYLVWKGDQFLNAPGNGLLTYNIKINTPGTYRFLWRSRITNGTSGSEHNDSWLRFADASSFYGKKGESIVYPGDTGQTPNPNGSSKDGWFKIYKSGPADEWKWQSSTSDNDAHDIYVDFDTAGTYTMEVSARSSFHALDRFVLFTENVSQSDATSETATLSEINCN
ncbi:hypothetical protein [Aquimarina litoralis]|uniref:hypothetical protein n=1 Tax=Aquimarina litoralis TaxID=584605 RepID=UPI001C560CC7|nr:hypothetical protein [Aquimarina litoralis]MBW1296851.1 hypothetical protein [Aquimarina litoralis]